MARGLKKIAAFEAGEFAEESRLNATVEHPFGGGIVADDFVAGRERVVSDEGRTQSEIECREEEPRT